MSVTDLIVLFLLQMNRVCESRMKSCVICFCLVLWHWKVFGQILQALLLILLTCLVSLCFSMNISTRRNPPPTPFLPPNKNLSWPTTQLCVFLVCLLVCLLFTLLRLSLSKTCSCRASFFLPFQWPFSHVNTFCCHANEKWKLLLLLLALLCLWCDLQIKRGGRGLAGGSVLFLFVFFFSRNPSFSSSPE